MNRQKIVMYIYKLRVYTPREILVKITHKLYRKTYRWFFRRNAYRGKGVVPNNNFIKALDDFRDIKSLNDYLISSSNVAFIFNEELLLNNDFISKYNINIAQNIISGQLEVLGRCCKTIEGKIDWFTDFTNGYKWNGTTYYSDLHYEGVKGSDIKIPWELCRLQFLWPLLSAFIISGEKAYYKQLVSLIEDWINKNPTSFGPGWLCTMDVGIRAANLSLLLKWLQTIGVNNNKTLFNIFHSLFSHADFIVNNLEYGELTSNHYLSNIVGLVYIAVFCPEIRQSDEWLAYGIQELISEMKREVNEDGSDFEASTCYHRLVTELFLSATIIISRIDNDRRKRLKNFNHDLKPLVGPSLKPLSGQEFSLEDPLIFPKWYFDKLENMLEFIMYITKPNGKAPQIGDNDSGRLHKFTPIGLWNSEIGCFEEDLLDHRHLLAVGGKYFSRYDFCEIGLPYQAEAFWYGFDSYNKDIEPSVAELRSKNCLRNLKSQGYPDFGLYIMRQGENYMAVRCGTIGQKQNGGHAHNDQLSFELHVNGEDIFVDPGTYLYTPDPDWRNYFRSTANHNTVMIDNEEQNRFFDWTLFAMSNDSKARCINWEIKESYDIFEGEHYGYTRLNKPIKHRRKIEFDKQNNSWIIEDIFKGAEESDHRLQWSFLLAPEIIDCILINSTVLIKSKQQKFHIKVSFPGDIDIIDSWFSSKYGIKHKTKIIRISSQFKTNKSYLIKLYQ